MKPGISDGFLSSPFAAIGGVRVVTNPLAETLSVRHEVRRHPIRKRRRNWCVVRVEERKPGAYMVGSNTLVVHPALLPRLKDLMP